MSEKLNSCHFDGMTRSSNEPSDTMNTSFERLGVDPGRKLVSASTAEKSMAREGAVSSIRYKTEHVQDTLRKKHYSTEVNHIAEKLQFNIVVVGSPRVGKSQLINAICNDENRAETSASLNSCTKKVTCYVLEDNQQRTPGIKPFKINFFDTPGIESWDQQGGQNTMLKFIKDKDPVCLIYCAAPGTYADLSQLHSVLQFCKEKGIFCALVCTNMWSNANRDMIIQEFEKELAFFGERVEKIFDQPQTGSSHKVTFFGNDALCTMVNSTEYDCANNSFETKPIQGIDELIHGVMEALDHDKFIDWYNAVL